MQVWNPVTGQMQEVPDVSYNTFDAMPDLTAGTAPQVDIAGPLKKFGVDLGVNALTSINPALGLGARGALAIRDEAKAGIERDEATAAQREKDLAAQGTPLGTPNVDQQLGLGSAPPAAPIPATVTTTTRTLQAPGEKQALGDLKSETEKGAQATEEQGRIKSDVAAVEAEGAGQKARLGEDHATALQVAQDQQNPLVQKARDQFLAEQDKYSKMEIKDYYEGHTGRHIADAIAVGLGELGAVLAKTGHNTALEIVRSRQKDWYDQERAKIEKQYKVTGMARDKIALAQDAKQEAITDLNITATARNTALSDKTEAEAKKVGTSHALAEGARMASALRADAAKTALQAAEGLRTRVTTEPNPAARAGGANNDRYVYGAGGQPIAETRSPAEATKANTAIAAYRKLDGILSQLERSYQKNGRVLNPLSDVAQERKALQSQATIAYKDAAQLGALSGPDMGLVEQGIGGGVMGTISPEAAIAKLRAARASGTKSHAAALDSLGLPGARIAQSLRAEGAPQAGGQPLTDQDKAALNWANAHRDDPRAKEILRLHGL